MTVIGAILILAAIFLVIVVLMQHGKSHNLSGTIAGASETFFGKNKASTIDKKLSVATSVVAVVFVVLVLVAYLVSGNSGVTDSHEGHDHSTEASTTVADSAEATADGTGTADADTAEPTGTAVDTEAPAETTDADTTPVETTSAE